MNPGERVALGRTAVQVTRLGLGTVPIGGWGGAVPDEEARAIIRRSYELGLRLIDTAPLYGFGLAERRIGDVLPEFPREEIVLATKVGRLVRPVTFTRKVRQVLWQAASGKTDGVKLVTFKTRRVLQRLLSRNAEQIRLGFPFDRGEQSLGEVFDFSYAGVMRSLEESLRRLRVDRVDILHIHDPDFHFEQAVSGAYRALDRLRAEGTIGAIGVGMTQAELLARFARETDIDCFLLAGRYTLLDQTALDELLPICTRKGIALIIGGVYNSGVLTNPQPGAKFDYVQAPPAVLERARRLRAVCDRYDVPLMAAAIQFPFGHPAVASVLTGTRTVSELETNVRMFQHAIPPDLWREMRAEGLLSERIPLPIAAAVGT